MKIITTKQLKDLVESEDKEYVLIDVREKYELKHGIIPSSKNIPLSEFKESFKLTKEEFFKNYGFRKPLKQIKMIIYCRKGVRAKDAVKIALKQGYNAILYKESVWKWSEIDSKVKKYEL